MLLYSGTPKLVPLRGIWLFSIRRNAFMMTVMYSGGNITVYVSDMDTSVRFYTEQLGLKLVYRFGDKWASIHAGKGLTIGLHPASPRMPAGRPGSMAIGLELDGKIDDAVRRLQEKGVQFDGPMNRGEAGNFAAFHDPDGNQLYLAELNMRHVNQGEGEYTHA
jgi:catechol 2,3-dioxygenase-like lactoylglutathione lyase family enzyme